MAPVFAGNLGDADDVSCTESKGGGAENNDEQENVPEGKEGGGKSGGRHFGLVEKVTFDIPVPRFCVLMGVPLWLYYIQ